MYLREMRTVLQKLQYANEPSGLDDSMRDAWHNMQQELQDYFDAATLLKDKNQIEEIFSNNCVLYFPANRFEEPAWLNEENLKAHAKYMEISHLTGYTGRRIVSYSPLRENQDWIFDLLYDSTAFRLTVNIPIGQDGPSASLPVTLNTEYSARSNKLYETALGIVQKVTGRSNIKFSLGRRFNRTVSITENNSVIVPNLFQMSAGETALMNIFFTILRDFDMAGASFEKAEDVRGIVLVDEIDLHLHASHQYGILPDLLKMFPKIQFVVTTHAPLFVLGMNRVFGESGFDLYRLPDGQQISPEEFSEFEQAYRSFSQSERFDTDLRQAIVKSQEPLVFMEGTTDVKYVRKAAEHLGQDSLLAELNLDQAGSSSNLSKIWNTMRVATLTTQRVFLVYDCDTGMHFERNGEVFRRSSPYFDEHPVKKGIENLFSRDTLERARIHKTALIDIEYEHMKTDRGEEAVVPETWSVHRSEKTNLCNWLCENGTVEDFQYFNVIFDLLSQWIEEEPAT